MHFLIFLIIAANLKLLIFLRTLDLISGGLRKTNFLIGLLPHPKLEIIFINIDRRECNMGNIIQYNLYWNSAQDMIKRLKLELGQTKDTLEMHVEENQRLQKRLQV